jgi:hypothetical protein
MTLRKVRDHCREDQEILYQLIPLPHSHMVFQWKGRWGGVERLHPQDHSPASHVMGPRSLAHRDVKSDKLNLWERPLFFYYFYFIPSRFYQKMVLTIKAVQDREIRDAMYEVVFRIGRLRAQVDHTLRHKYAGLGSWQKAVLSEASPFVILSMNRDRLIDRIYARSTKKLGIKRFQTLMRSMAKENIETIRDHLKQMRMDVKELKGDPLNFYRIKPLRLLTLISEMTNLPAHTVERIYDTADWLPPSPPIPMPKAGPRRPQ